MSDGSDRRPTIAVCSEGDERDPRLLDRLSEREREPQQRKRERQGQYGEPCVRRTPRREQASLDLEGTLKEGEEKTERRNGREGARGKQHQKQPSRICLTRQVVLDIKMESYVRTNSVKN